MTSLAFVLGVLPLVIASGAGAAARQSMGTGVFGGMLVATFVATGLRAAVLRAAGEKAPAAASPRRRASGGCAGRGERRHEAPEDGRAATGAALARGAVRRWRWRWPPAPRWGPITGGRRSPCRRSIPTRRLRRRPLTAPSRPSLVDALRRCPADAPGRGRTGAPTPTSRRRWRASSRPTRNCARSAQPSCPRSISAAAPRARASAGARSARRRPTAPIAQQPARRAHRPRSSSTFGRACAAARRQRAHWPWPASPPRDTVRLTVVGLTAQGLVRTALARRADRTHPGHAEDARGRTAAARPAAERRHQVRRSTLSRPRRCVPMPGVQLLELSASAHWHARSWRCSLGEPGLALGEAALAALPVPPRRRSGCLRRCSSAAPTCRRPSSSSSRPTRRSASRAPRCSRPCR